MERRLHRALYLVQISLLLLVAGCGGKKEIPPAPTFREEGKIGVEIQQAHFLQSDAKGQKLLEIWANSSKGEEERLTLKEVKTILYDKDKPFAEISAVSAVYQPNKGFLLLNKVKLMDLSKGVQITCDSLEVLSKERKIEGSGVHLKWGDLALEGKKFLADWGLKKGVLKSNATIRINMKRRTR